MTAGHHHGDGPQLIGVSLRLPLTDFMQRLLSGLQEQFPDLTPAMQGVFQNIDHPPDGTRQTDLADRMGIGKQALGELIDAMERKGYVERRPEIGDRRVKRVHLTERGWAVHEAAPRIAQEIQDDWAGLIGEARMADLLATLGELIDQLHARIPKIG